MIEAMKQKALAVAAANVLEFIPQFHGKWDEGYALLLECVASGQEPEHCTFREGTDFWSWEEAIRVIEEEAKAIWKPFEDTFNTELSKHKSLMLHQAVKGKGVAGAITEQSLAGLSKEMQHPLLIQALQHAVIQANEEIGDDERGHFDVMSYSGRFMYGRYCLALYQPPGKSIAQVSMHMGTVFKLLGDPTTDELGKGLVLYWPRIACCDEQLDHLSQIA